jgi:hypothetical protein
VKTLVSPTKIFNMALNKICKQVGQDLAAQSGRVDQTLAQGQQGDFRGVAQVQFLFNFVHMGAHAGDREIECLRQDIGMMDNNLQTLNDENIKVVNPLIVTNFEHL